MDKLTEYILATSGEPWRYGFSDCAPWVARWVREATGGPVEFPEYHDKAGSFRIIMQAGGLLPLFSSLASNAGLAETASPVRGDIGLLKHTRALSGQMLAVCLGGDKWAGRVYQTCQVATFSNQIIKAWSVNWQN